MLDQIIFYLFATLAVVSAVLVVTSRNAIHSAIFLITALLATAGIYLQLRAELLFAIQIVLYVGGIMVLFLFVIMLVNLDVSVRQIQFSRQKYVAAIMALALGGLVLMGLYIRRGPEEGQLFPMNLPPAVHSAMGPNTEAVADVLFRRYMLPFEIASILLLVAMVGAVVLAKKRI
jgi:NADH-quinone oxidoreductase subunit J